MDNREMDPYLDGKRESFNPWSSYSDLLCSLLLVFILLTFFIISQSLNSAESNQLETEKIQSALAEQEAQLEAQGAVVEKKQVSLDAMVVAMENNQAELDDLRALCDARTEELDSREAQIVQQQSAMLTQESELQQQQIALDNRASEVESLQATLNQQADLLSQQQSALESQENAAAALQAALDQQTAQMEQLVGVRGEIVQALNQAFQQSGIAVGIDTATGAITLPSGLMFDTGSSEMSEAGKNYLAQFIPVYLNVLLSDAFAPYIAEIIIEGHTDNNGDYLMNLELSQQRALKVAAYCLDENNAFAAPEQMDTLRSIITANGRSFSSPILSEDGSINQEASRRVEIKFRLRDQEMVERLLAILNS